MRTFALWLAIMMTGVMQSNAATITIALYGDSTTKGAQTVNGVSYPTTVVTAHLVLQEMLKLRFPNDTIVVNRLGNNGAQLVELVNGLPEYTRTWEAEMAASNANIVLLNFGLNDSAICNPDANGVCQAPLPKYAGRVQIAPSAFRTMLKGAIQTARNHGKIVVVEESNPVVALPNPTAPIYQYVYQQRQAASQMNAPLVPKFDYMQTLPDWRSFISEASDGVHPNSAGYAIIAKQMYDVLVPIIDGLI